MRFSWENENCQRFSWESHELFTKSHENLTRFSFSRENWNVFSWDFLAFMSFSWDYSWVSHEILVSLFFTWKLERFLMRISWECHEILMSIFGRFLMKTLHMEIDACTEFSWDSHRAEIFSRDSHESAVVSWASHEILMRLSRDSYEILTRFRYTGITNTNPIHPFFSSTFFFCTTCYVWWSDPGCKKINNIFCIYIYKNLLKSDSHSLIQTLPLFVLTTLNN